MWTIKPLNVATLNLTRVASISKVGYDVNAGEIIQVPDVAWLLRDDESGRVILVDTGPGDQEYVNRFHSPIEKRPEQELEYVLRQEDIEPGDIDTVILTHLHWDHGYGVYKLPNAKVYVQRSELQYSVAPFAVHRGAYELNDTSKPPYYFKFYHQIAVLDGDTAFCDGIDLITIPGHSPGSQGVLVETAKGRYFITGDLYYNFQNYNEDIPTGVYTSLYDYHASFAKVKNLGSDVTLLPGHDYSVFDVLK